MKGLGLDMVMKMKDGVVELFPNIISAIVVFFVGLFIAKIVAKIVATVLQKVGIDKLKDKLNEIDLIGKSNFDVVPSVFISKFLYYFIVLIFMLIVTDILKIDALTDLVSSLVNLLPNVLVAIIVLIIGLLVGEAVKKIVLVTCKSMGIPGANIIGSFIFFFVLINALMIALKKVTIPTGFLTDNLTVIIGGIVAAFSIGYGLASKNMMSNFLASFYSKGKFQVGDTITIGDTRGEIIEMDNISLILLSEGTQVIFPLNKLTTEKIIKHNI